MDQRLLMAVLAVVKLDTAAVEEKWKELFSKFCQPSIYHSLNEVHTEYENITQPTKRAIVEHIAKLKKTLGISAGKAASGDSPSTPRKTKAKGAAKPSRKTKPGLGTPDSLKDEDRDDTENPAEIKDERMDSPVRGSVSSTPSPSSRGKPQAKRRRASLTDEESSDDEAVSIKSEESEFRGPRSRIDGETPSPTRSQAPRRAKTERKVSWVELSSTEEDPSDDEFMDAMIENAKGTDGDNDVKKEVEEAQIGQHQAEADDKLVQYDAGIMIIE